MTATITDFAALTGTYAIDPAHTRFGFVARHAMVTKVRGSFNEFEGTTTVDGADLSKSSVSITLKTASIDTRNAQRDGHLLSNDFLDVANHPEITFVSTSIAHQGGDDFEVSGNLTIKGVTKSITFPLEFTGSATDPFGNHRVGLEGAMSINRSDFGVNFNAALETGGVLVSEKVTIECEISAIKSA
ncbi:YceI family protein [uncultured Jatrophihabitans sp.]|uniref:YceI family protein n=1 Tax=uncultured Jatrophihabitans sp. TaxID=1610747 RepID=UPI0035CB9B4C